MKTFDPKTILTGKNILLRHLKRSDAKDITTNINDKNIVRFLLTVPYPYKNRDAYKFIRMSYYEMVKNNKRTFGIALNETNRIIGGIDLFKINSKNKNAEVGYWLGRNYWNLGFMTEAVQLILQYGFSELSLHRIYAIVLEKNDASMRVLEKCGFHLEGVLRDAEFRRNRYHDKFTYGILKSEFRRKV
jgi:RimJ/RimL family protein N-acetyltransferase